MYNSKNYSKDGGDTWVVGGTIDFTDATIIGNVENQTDSVATTVAGVKDDLNALLAKLKAAGIMIADE